MLVNFFFGTLVNGAFAIAYQVESYVMLFVSNLGTASAPQITQSYSSGNISQAVKLCSQINRYTILITAVVFFSLFIELDNVMALWLKKVPDGALLYTQWMLVYLLIKSFSACLFTYVYASGKVKWFQIVGSGVELIVLPFSYILFKEGFPAETIIILLVLFYLLNIVLMLYLMRFLLAFDSKQFVIGSYISPICVLVILALWIIAYYYFSLSLLFTPLGGIVITGIVSAFVAYFIGLKKSERQRIQEIIKRRI
ncbi:MAG: hypothetical protein LUE99_08770 [Bacteroides sp.]|nr:hypothetical protein [Bacteroides sp.]